VISATFGDNKYIKQILDSADPPVLFVQFATGVPVAIEYEQVA
jgi:hypothetical protein